MDEHRSTKHKSGRAWYIYSLSDPRGGGVRYVGKTDNPGRRLKHHLAESTGSQWHTYKSAWIRKLSADGVLPAMVVLETGTCAMAWPLAEARWIRELRAAGARLTNLTPGGEGGRGHALTAEGRAKMSARFKGVPLSEEHRAKLRAAKLGRSLSAESIAKRTESRRGMRHSSETRAKMSASAIAWRAARRAARAA